MCKSAPQVAAMAPKSAQMEPKSTILGALGLQIETKFAIVASCENLIIYYDLTTFSRPWAFQFGPEIVPWALRPRGYHFFTTFGRLGARRVAPRGGKWAQRCPKGAPGRPKILQKSKKNRHLAPSGFQGVPGGGHPLQNARKRYPNRTKFGDAGQINAEPKLEKSRAFRSFQMLKESWETGGRVRKSTGGRAGGIVDTEREGGSRSRYAMACQYSIHDFEGARKM